MAEKVVLRLKERDYRKKSAAVLAWCQNHAEDCDGFLRSLDAALHEETRHAATDIARKAREKLATIELDLGGGGNYPLLYFLSRYLNPAHVLETGVAAGWSSQAILMALKQNGKGGQLWSSDFPYFRYKSPEELVGFVVAEDLKAAWHYFLEGDKFNLPAIIKECGPIGLFHYDSDKSYSGRAYAIRTATPRLADDAVIIFDDIQDNFHFRDYVTESRLAFKVFAFEGKYVGLTGGILNDA